jgi:hypothetical protein
MAAPGPDAVARAEALFHEGEARFDAARFTEACNLFEQSQNLDPKLGTLLNLAFCHEKIGRLATARTELLAALLWAANKQQRDRADFARDRLASIEPRLSFVQFEVEDREGTTELLVDGNPIPPSSWGPPVALDPGTHTIEVFGKEGATGKHRLVVADGPSTEIFLVRRLAPGQVFVTSPRATTSLEPSNPGATRRAIGWGFAGLTGVALATGTAFGLLAVSTRDDALAMCAGDLCTQQGADRIDEARRHALVSSIAFATAAGAGVVGAYLFLSAPSSRRTAIGLAPSSVGMGIATTLSGSF